MYRHILLPTDGSELSATAVRDGIKFAKELGARVTALHVTAPFHPTETTPSAFTAHIAEHEAKAKESAQQALGVVTEAARAAGVPCATLHRVSNSPYEAIIALAEDAGCDLVFMASHGRRGVAALLLGSETNKVLTHSKIPVLVTR
ncbi:MAG TPA: universal stress protein [Methylomirabilota bacterium]|nr:universal stress protein [Methylomirabilota bacterium]